MRPLAILPVGLVVLGAVMVGGGDRLANFLGGERLEVTSPLSGRDAEPVSGEETATVVAQADGTAPQTQSPKVDETALRYFAAKGDTKRLEAEIARLKALYPNWTPPKNPLAVQPTTDTQIDEMWKLYSEGKFADVRKAIADRISADPTWKPPQDLLDRLGVAEARTQLVNASDLKQYEAVLRLGAANPSLLTCGDVDVLWRLAEAFARTERNERAREAYFYVLRNCDKPEERLATVQKASSLLPRVDLDQLLAEERKTPEGIGEFDSVRAGIARQALADAGKDPKLVVVSHDIALVEKLAETDKLVSDELLLGWYYLRRENLQGALKWFGKAYESQNSAETAQGLALAYVDTDQPAQAEAVLYQWRDTSDDIKNVYLAAVANLLAIDPPPQLSSEQLDRMSRVAASARNTPVAQQFGWYADAFNQFQTATQWFTLALSWTPTDEPSAYGLALMHWKLGETARLGEIQRAWAGRSERIARVGEPEDKRRDKKREAVPAQQETPTVAGAPVADAPVRRQARQVQDSHDTIREEAAAPRAPVSGVATRRRSCLTTQDPTGLSPAQALNRGWCLMDVNRPLEAAAAFEVALRGSGHTRTDAAYGQSLAYLRAGLSDMAAIASTKAPLNKKRGAEIRTSLLEQQALAAFENGRYHETLAILEERSRIAPERINLMVLRGYAFLKLRRFGDAEQLFRAAAATGDRDALRGLGDLQLARQAN